jgi:hypothetical protein
VTVRSGFRTGSTFTVTFNNSGRSDWDIIDFSGVNSLSDDWTLWWWVSFWSFRVTGQTVFFLIDTGITLFGTRITFSIFNINM